MTTTAGTVGSPPRSVSASAPTICDSGQAPSPVLSRGNSPISTRNTFDECLLGLLIDRFATVVTEEDMRRRIPPHLWEDANVVSSVRRLRSVLGDGWRLTLSSGRGIILTTASRFTPSEYLIVKRLKDGPATDPELWAAFQLDAYDRRRDFVALRAHIRNIRAKLPEGWDIQRRRRGSLIEREGAYRLVKDEGTS